jgi:hypothetical protein
MAGICSGARKGMPLLGEGEGEGEFNSQIPQIPLSGPALHLQPLALP